MQSVDVCAVLKKEIRFTDLAAAEDDIAFAEEMVSMKKWTSQAVQAAVKALRVQLNGEKIKCSLQKSRG